MAVDKNAQIGNEKMNFQRNKICVGKTFKQIAKVKI